MACYLSIETSIISQPIFQPNEVNPQSGLVPGRGGLFTPSNFEDHGRLHINLLRTVSWVNPRISLDEFMVRLSELQQPMSVDHTLTHSTGLIRSRTHPLWTAHLQAMRDKAEYVWAVGAQSRAFRQLEKTIYQWRCDSCSLTNQTLESTWYRTCSATVGHIWSDAIDITSRWRCWLMQCCLFYFTVKLV